MEFWLFLGYSLNIFVKHVSHGTKRILVQIPQKMNLVGVKCKKFSQGFLETNIKLGPIFFQSFFWIIILT